MTVPLYNLTDTWNAGATVFTAIQMNVTDTASAATSELMDLQISGTSKFNVVKSGVVNFGGAILPITSDGAAIGSASFQWSDEFLASGGVINWANGAVTITHDGTHGLGISAAALGSSSQLGIQNTGGDAGVSDSIVGFTTGSDNFANAAWRLVSGWKTIDGVGTSFILRNNNTTGVFICWASGGFSINTAVDPSANNLGMPTGGVIKFGGTNATITHATGSLSTNNINLVHNTAAIATNATDGFFYIPTCAGTPTGTPTTFTGRVPMIFDTTNSQFWFFTGGAWKQPKTPAGAAIVTWQ